MRSGKIENLRSMADYPPEERKAMQSAGGKASAEARKRNASIRESLKFMLALPDFSLEPDEVTKVMSDLGIDSPTAAEGMVASALLKARKGDIEAARFVRDSSGELPTSKVELSGDLGKPIAGMDLTQLTDDQLRQLADKTE